jgi:exonuclease III
MKLAVWNCRGLGNTSAVRGILKFQKSKRVDVLLLLETKLDEKRMTRWWWMQEGYNVDAKCITEPY